MHLLLKKKVKILVLALVASLAFGLLPTQAALATDEITADTPFPNIVEIQAQVDEASARFDDATTQIAELRKEIELLSNRIDTIQECLPDARDLSDQAARDYYRMLSTSNPFLEMVLGATSLTEFFAKVEYSTRLNQSYIDNITSLTRLNDELEGNRGELEGMMVALEDERLRAEEALIDAQNARLAAEETARLIAEATAAATAAAAAAAAAAEESHVPAAPLPPSFPGMPESPSDKQAFVDLWTPRIDAYLAGSPMAGFGYAFANAAFDYNVDPRWSPAIACLESSKGRYCFRAYNAWGWGQVDWPDWETAIYAHIRGMSTGYGYTISEAAARKYCPPNWAHWYTVISSEMTRI
ncbi:MAG: hypothetical protein FWD27_04685 [Coriobacteriia bacterium]|nr:hypothetical protein [Coriobacteriia bacterium]